MMQKPQMKREVMVKNFYAGVGYIGFYSTADASTEFSEFGTLRVSDSEDNLYYLYVDIRFDFDEVLEFIKGYGQA